MHRCLSRLISIAATVLVIVPLAVGRVGAQEQLAARGPRFVAVSTSTHKLVDASGAAVLRGRIALDLEGVSLAAALDEISKRAGIQLIYSREVVPVGAPVTLQSASITVGAALTAVLFDTGLDVVISASGRMALVKKLPSEAATAAGAIAGRVTDAKTQTALAGATVVVQGTSRSATTGSDGRYRIADVAPGTYTVRARYIGYAPGSASVTVSADQEATADLALEKSAQRLDEVVTTGTVVPTEVRAVPTPISIVTGDEIEQKGYQRVDQIFRGDIPGALAWDNGAAGNYSDIAIRGATTLTGASSVKTYIDGVEVSDPTSIATIDPSSIERIEMLRGPQGSTMYGSQALSGVLQIFTKRGQFNTSRPQVEAKVSGGLIESQWGNAPRTDNSVGVTGGARDFSYRFGGGYAHNGDWVQSGAATDKSLYGGLQGTQGPLTVDFSGRYYDKAIGSPFNPALNGYTYYSKPFDQTLDLRQQTYGLSLQYAATPHWQHSLVVGYDRELSDNAQNQPRFTTPSDSLLFVYSLDISKASVAYHTTYQAPIGRVVQSSLTAGADYWTYHDGGVYAGGATTSNNVIQSPDQGYRFHYDNSGYFAQEQLGFWDALFVTGGLRAENNQNFGKDFGIAWAPRVGASYVRSVGDVTIKARVSHGKAIRVPFPGQAEAVVAPFANQLANPNLGPEQQLGTDGGLELYFGARGSLEANYYHQTADDLIAYVLVDLRTTPASFQYQNVGRIRNTGWEFQGRLNAGRLALAGTYSITNSVVAALSPTYNGDLKLGDQLLNIPQHTAGATASYSLGRTAATLGLTWVGSWTGYDLLAFYGFAFGGQPYRGSFRAYWTTYPSFVKLNLSVSQGLTDRLSVFVQSNNLTNNNNYERNNMNLTSGRSTLIGLRTKF